MGQRLESPFLTTISIQGQESSFGELDGLPSLRGGDKEPRQDGERELLGQLLARACTSQL